MRVFVAMKAEHWKQRFSSSPQGANISPGKSNATVAVLRSNRPRRLTSRVQLDQEDGKPFDHHSHSFKSLSPRLAAKSMPDPGPKSSPKPVK
jgi:hypothetical protein